MDVHVSKRAFTSGLARVTRIIPNNSVVPGLNLLKVTMKDEHIELTGSNGEIDVQAKVPADFSGEREVAMPATVLAQIARALPDDDVQFTFEEGGMRIKSGKFKTRINLIDAQQAPTLAFPDEELARIPAHQLAHLLDTVRYAASKESFQGVFRGVLLEPSEDKTRAIATDGYRLALTDATLPIPFQKPTIIPGKAVDELVRILDAAGDDEEVVVYDGGERISIATRDARMNASLMGGTFPDYRRVFPSAFVEEIRLETASLTSMLQRVNVMSNKQANNRIDLTVRDGTLTATSEGDYGKAREELRCISTTGNEELVLSFNASFLLDALKPMDGDTVIQISGTSSPCILKPTDKTHAYTAMVVPLRTG